MSKVYHREHLSTLDHPGLTRLIHHRQGGHSSLHKDVECLDDGRVGVDESDVVVRTDAQLPEGLLHEGWLWHFTHLAHTNTQ